ncbi:DEAD DEAH box helicase [Chlorella sorokiniana]|uniref:DEAD DEAH box helicase n=1 Tax=Chlorella sorokiniana TaxID=3076 RepID=A0A2P6TML2_CHLSO|nr:DEAD DEAH box helicase [Chlorella sorokiniana]|eukprot:PRW45545.1 DEAD DEAH box helicase [Chlorella sorokiniana]
MAAQVRAACPPSALTGHAQHLAAAARRPEAAPSAGSAWRRQRRRQRRPVACPSSSLSGSSSSSSSSTAASPEASALLDQFWLARGVVDEQQRRQLVAAAGAIRAELDAEAFESSQQQLGLQLPSLSAAWFLEEQRGSSPQVAAASRRILALQQLLGGGDVDVVWMLVREPRLLSTDFRSIAQRLFDMRVAEGSDGLDIIALVEQQPALLLQADTAVSSDEEETAAERLQAWQHGLVSDNSTEWARRFGQLQQYVQAHGDAHVGCRDGDNAELARWASKQRSEHKAGQLAEGKQTQLAAAGFEFDGERAEWLRWFNEIRAFKERHGHCQPQPLAHPNDFLLINWCSVQRIMRRCGVMPEERIAALDELGFDWTGADPLS